MAGTELSGRGAGDTPRDEASFERSGARTVANAPLHLWAWPYGLVVPVLLLAWYLLPVGWLWVVLAFVAGVLIALRTWSEAGRHAPGPNGEAR